MDVLERLGGRKFVLAIISLVAGLLTHALSPKGLSTEVVAMIVGLVGTFSIANTVSTVHDIKTNKDEPVVSTSILTDEQLLSMMEKIAGIETTTEAIGASTLQTQQILVNALQSKQG